MSKVNVQAFSDFTKACEPYLEANGWEKVSHGRWRVPKQFGIHAGDLYFQWRAVEAQYEYDSEQLR